MFPFLAMCLLFAAQAEDRAADCQPRLMRLKADDAGKVMFSIIVDWKTKQIGFAGNRDGTGTPVTGIIPEVKTVELGDLKDLTIYTATGAKVTLKDARQRLAAGATVVVSGDGKPVSSAFLKVFKDDTLILVSPELIDARFGGPLGTLPPLR